MAADGLSASTTRERARVLRRFQKVTGVHPKDAKRRDVERWWRELETLAPASRRTYLSHLRSYYAAVDKRDPTRHLRVPARPRYAPRPLDEADYAMVLRMVGGDVGVWVALAGRVGLRCVELARMRPADVERDADGARLRVEGKGGRVRWVPLDAELERRLAGYSWPDVTASTVSKMVARAMRSVGVDATAHQLRHTAATRYLEASGFDLAGTSRFLGHASVSTTMVYARTDVRREREVLARLADVDDDGAVVRPAFRS